MAFLLNRTSLSQLRLKSQMAEESLKVPRRGIHIEPGAREQALLAQDPALKRFKSHKKSVTKVKRLGDILTVVVVAGCCYEIYVKATMREQVRKQAGESA